MLKSRRKAREAALQAIYGLDLLGEWSDEMIDSYFRLYHPDLQNDPDAKPHIEFARTLITGVRSEIVLIDREIGAVSEHWSIARMCRIDRNILRAATYEIGYVPDVPLNVTINEAIELAKEYGGDESPTFVNGVIDKVAKRLQNDARFKNFVRAKAQSQRNVG